MDDLNDDSRKVAEDIIEQTRLGFREEATKRIFCILDSHHQLQNEITEFKKQKEEEGLSAARDRIEIWLKEKRKRISFDALRKDLGEPSYTDDFLMKMINKYPKVFRRSGDIITKQGNKPGITLTRDESQDT